MLLKTSSLNFDIEIKILAILNMFGSCFFGVSLNRIVLKKKKELKNNDLNLEDEGICKFTNL